MTQATGAYKQVAFIAETVFGVTPSTPQTQLIEVVDFKITSEAPLLTDPSVRADRQVGFARRGNESASGEFEVVACAGNYDKFIEAALQGTWATNVLKIGQAQRSFAFEEGFTDIGQFHTFNGVVFDSISMEITTDKLVSMKFGVIGASESAFSGTSIDVTPTVITNVPKFYHVGGVFKEGGSTVGYVTALNWTLKNGCNSSHALGSTSVRAITSGKVEVTGKVTALFESIALYNKAKNNTDTSLEYTLTDGTNSHTYSFPKVTYGKASINGSGAGPLVVELDFTAVYDATDASTVKVTRT